ncbi:S-layer protein [Pyrococcus sp. ST04]|uniref:S-layer protein n=1 Tax=Pyrococcus sp. ST04 TaxID=1183377 RepID=UPI0002605BF2|nr:S-layer protein [Pyrococcus sp. ST04]AFK22926.1 putative ATPase, vanadate-sensitive [Pyrococcus sp. ST04]
MKVKKIAALVVGAAMAGATLGLASAQPQVPEIPKEFFVKDGQPNVKIVVGSEGAAMDVVSAADIAAAIGSLLYTEKDVEVSGVTVVAKKDVTSPLAEIPVFDNYDTDSGHLYTEDMNLTDVPAWWNGAAFSATFDNSVWADTIYNTTEDTDNYLKLRVDNLASLGDEELAAKVQLSGIRLVGINETEGKIEDFKDFKVEIPEVTANISFVIYKYTLEGPTKVDPITKESTTPTTNLVTNLVLDNSTLPIYYPEYSGWKITGVSVVSGTGITDKTTFTLLGKKFSVIAVGENLITGESCDACFTYGKDWGVDYYEQGATPEFDGYKVKILDIDINRDKALLEVTSPSGDTETVTVDTSAPVVLFDGGIRIELLDTFVGIAGTNTVKLHVWTDLKTFSSGDEVIPGWVAEFAIENGAIKWIAVKNKEALSGDTVKLFDTYVVDYKSTIYGPKETSDEKKAYAMEAYVYIEPAEHEYETVEASIGDSIDGYEVTDIKVKVNPDKAYIPSKLTEPITVLDTEIMEQGLENVDSNLILVGGPVVNKVTAALADSLGIPTTYEEWKEKYGTGAESGQVIYKEKCSKIGGYGVVLVAGTDREGTRAAAEALLEYLSKL